MPRNCENNKPRQPNPRQVNLSVAAETCDDENDVQLITAAIPQTAAEPDSGAIEPVLDALERHHLTPEAMLADTAYGSDDNVQTCEAKGVQLVSPTPGKKPDDAYAINSDLIQQARLVRGRATSHGMLRSSCRTRGHHERTSFPTPEEYTYVPYSCKWGLGAFL